MIDLQLIPISEASACRMLQRQKERDLARAELRARNAYETWLLHSAVAELAMPLARTRGHSGHAATQFANGFKGFPENWANPSKYGLLAVFKQGVLARKSSVVQPQIRAMAESIRLKIPFEHWWTV